MRAWYLINLFKILFSPAVSHVQQYFTIAVISSFGTDKNAINHNVYFAPRLSGLIGSNSFNFNFQFSPDTEMSRLLPHILCLLLINLFSRLSDLVLGTSFLLLLMANCKWKKKHFMWVSMYLARITNWWHYFVSFPTGDGTAILHGHQSHAKFQPLAVQREYLHFSVILRPWVLVRLW